LQNTAEEKAQQSDILHVETSRFGKIQITTGQIVTLPKGLVGFPQQKRFVLLSHREDSPFLWLQSIDDPTLAFVVVLTAAVVPEYQIELHEEDKQELQLQDEGQCAVYGLVTIPRQDPTAMTINLLGPIVINTNKLLGKQLVLHNCCYSHRHPLLAPDNGRSQKACCRITAK